MCTEKLKFKQLTIRQFDLWRLFVGVYFIANIVMELQFIVPVYFLSNSYSHIDMQQYTGFADLIPFFMFIRQKNIINFIIFSKLILLLFFILDIKRRPATIFLLFAQALLSNIFPYSKLAPESQMIAWTVFASILIDRDVLKNPKGSRTFKFCDFEISENYLRLSIWMVIGSAYTYSFWTKIEPYNLEMGWKTGVAFNKIFLNIQEIRPSFRWFLGAAPLIVLKILTYSVLFIEGVPLLIMPFSKLRQFWNYFAIIMHMLILLTFELPIVSFGMLIVHFLLVEYRSNRRYQ